MMRSLSSAVTGLKSQQTAMDVLGNNIANVSTSGFKSSSTQFSDLFYQTLSSGTAKNNPSQIGYGTQVSNVSKNMSNSGATSTSKATDLYIDGSGYFALSSTKVPTASSTTTYTPTSYTRVGNFSFNSEGYLVDTAGNYVLSASVTGTSPDQTATYGAPICLYEDTSTTDSGVSGVTPTWTSSADSTVTEALTSTNYSDLSDISIGTDGTISASYNGATGTVGDSSNSDTPKYTVALASFVNDNGLAQSGSNDYTSTESSGTDTVMTAGMNASTTVIRSGELESSNVDISTELTNMIITQRGFQGNARVITTSDSMLEELVNLKRS